MKLSGSNQIKLTNRVSHGDRPYDSSEFASLIRNCCKIHKFTEQTMFSIKLTQGAVQKNPRCTIRFNECEVDLASLINDRDHLQMLLNNVIPPEAKPFLLAVTNTLLAVETSSKERLCLLILILNDLGCKLEGPLASLKSYFSSLGSDALDKLATIPDEALMQILQNSQKSSITAPNVKEVTSVLSLDEDSISEISLRAKVKELISLNLTRKMDGLFNVSSVISSRIDRLYNAQKHLKIASNLTLIATHPLKKVNLCKNIFIPTQAKSIIFHNLKLLSNERLKVLSAVLSTYANLKKISFDFSTLSTHQTAIILKNLKIKFSHSLDLSIRASDIKTQGAIELADIIINNSQLTSVRLDLSANNLGPEGSAALAKGISRTNRLSNVNLNLTNNNIGSKGTEVLALALSKNPQLTVLTLNPTFREQ